MTHKLSSKKTLRLIFILGCCLFLVFLNPKKVFNPFFEIFFKLSLPFQKIFYTLSQKTGNTLIFWSSLNEIREENEKLIKENRALLVETAGQKELQRENEELRKQLGLIPGKNFSLEASFVIGQNPQKLGSWILIDKGENSGITTGMPVIVSQGILIGKVEEVYADTAKVILLTDSESVINVRDLETEAKGVVRGKFGLGLVLEMVSQDDMLNAGDSIITSGLGGDLPKGLLVGKIQEPKVSLDRIFQGATVAVPVKYSNLDVVFVIKN
ncbi:MAG: rod shape-determining protein MreC [Candidatus Moranbacteria bacterium CG_4_9_14_3_um_filter_40_7]|nr:MAG: rod shape-determining protein MreC [Candidatus Moranbacteria bacterium CG_4_9_14_3_um_filter_40_7]